MSRMIASLLSAIIGVDVEWETHGIVGATADVIRSDLLPKLSDREHENVEHLVVIICGLNDWKTIFTKFPFGSGPSGFGVSLGELTEEISNRFGKNTQIFLPALPVEFGNADPKASFQVTPMKQSFFLLQNVLVNHL